MSGRRSLVGWLEDDDVSLTYDASRREVTRHVAGASEVVGVDPFAVLEKESWRRGPGVLGGLLRVRRPARPRPARIRLPDALWMQARGLRFFRHDDDPAAALAGRTHARVPREGEGPVPGVVRRGVRRRASPPARGQLLQGQPDLP
ncbi:MAG: hypothetical protein R2734_11735 [Nocardioides sp.]